MREALSVQNFKCMRFHQPEGWRQVPLVHDDTGYETISCCLLVFSL